MSRPVDYVDIASLFDSSVKAYPEKEALVDGNRRVTYAQLSRNVNCIARSLVKKGVKKGDKVSILFYNCVELAEVSLSVTKIGGIVVPLNFRLTGRELDYMDGFAQVIWAASTRKAICISWEGLRT